MVIAVDGPAGAGKSTVCRRLAQALGVAYLDTGAMYRAVAWALAQCAMDQASDQRMRQELPLLPLEFLIEAGRLRIDWEGSPLGDELRNPSISRMASLVSQRRPVRDFLTQKQRALSRGHDVVAEGRDMTTVVFPDAELKVFLTASDRVRAERRWKEYKEKGLSADLEDILRQIQERDAADSQRVLAPLKPGKDAIILDTSELSIDQVVEQLVRWAMEAREKALKREGSP
ncbi:cytidylate kinase [Desulfacinum hydrothermale DSM 13146]|uniref:Cytidylate kinase n=1 Tax=Desulfacinum hydrothermale DSM 13146 TaxID=1121390 RepID=A0A1W1XM34_9BACT|nr:(d)CMP kinase [Desulfacinum hydrothermale]SMC24904.1 cytidylate kinase [Desulfacinum hydrothermale DSM 13146]